MKNKDKQISENQKTFENLSNKSIEQRQLLNEMTKKYIEVARINTETAKKMKTMQEYQETIESKLEEKTDEIETLIKEYQEKSDAMKTILATKEAEIDGLTREVAKREVEDSGSCSYGKEVRDLKVQIDEKNKEIKKLTSALSYRNCNKQCAENMKRKDYILSEMHHRINYLSQKANEWYNAYRECQEDNFKLRKNLGDPR